MTERSKIPPGQQVVAPNKWPVIGERGPAAGANTDWTLSLDGRVKESITFSLEQLQAMPQTETVIGHPLRDAMVEARRSDERHFTEGFAPARRIGK